MFDDLLSSARAALEGVRPAEGSAELASQMRALQELASLTAAVQVEVTAAFVAGRRAGQVAAGMPARRVGQGITHEVALARRESPWRAERHVGLAHVLTRELPATHAALRAGETSEWRATVIARETGWLSAEHRAHIDRDLGPRLAGLGDREVEAEAKRLAYALDPRGLIRHLQRATGDRRVSVRPAPEGMAKLFALLPLTQGVAALAALLEAAATARAAGDPRSKGQVMADTLVERVTGQAHAAEVPVAVNVVITDQSLLRTGPGAEDPATVSGHGPVPAPFARDLLSRPGTPVTLRRVFTDPAGHLVTMETSSRAFTDTQREFVRLRDQCCQTPYCGAPITEIDHIQPHSRGGPTSLTNAQGLCTACNHAKGDTPPPAPPPPAAEAPPPPPLAAETLPAPPRAGPDIAYPPRRILITANYQHRRHTRTPARN